MNDFCDFFFKYVVTDFSNFILKSQPWLAEKKLKKKQNWLTENLTDWTFCDLKNKFRDYYSSDSLSIIHLSTSLMYEVDAF